MAASESTARSGAGADPSRRSTSARASAGSFQRAVSSRAATRRITSRIMRRAGPLMPSSVSAMSFDALKDLLVLLQLTQQLTEGRALEDALRAVTDATVSILPGDHASIRLLDSSRQHLLASARSGTGRDSPTMQMRAGEGIAGWVLEQGEPARVVDVRKDRRFVAMEGQGFAIGSMVVEPLVSEGAPIGVLAVSSPEVNAFSATDELLARLLANCSVGPIQRARLERLAVTDDLTLAFNGRYLSTRLLEEMERGARASS